MSKLIAALAFALLAVSTLEAQGAAAGYAPGAHRYRVTREVRSSQEVAGTVQSGTIMTLEELTLDLRATARDTLRFTFTIDSAARESDMPGATEAPPAKGRRVGGRISSQGSFHDFDAESAADPEIASGYRSFLPRLPAQPFRLGLTWTDTVQTPLTEGGIRGTTRTIIVSRVVGDTTIMGQKAWRVERTGTLTLSGTGNQDGADLILTGAGAATGMSHIGLNGVYLGGTSNQDLALTVEVPAASMTIPIKQSAVTRVERIGPGGSR